MNEYLQLFERKKQVVFYGPPGTGKTFIAQALATFCIHFRSGSRKVELPAAALSRHRRRQDWNSNHLTIVQFHPTYSYEDFVESTLR